jgi:hypothetical protein
MSNSNPSSPPTLSRQNSGTGIVAFQDMSPQMQRQMSFSSASHSIIPEKHLTSQTFSPKQAPRPVEERTSFTVPQKSQTDRYLNSLLMRTRGSKGSM